VLLTRGLWWPELPCRVPVDDCRAEEGWRHSRTGCSRGARGPLVARIGLRSPCGGNQGVKAARDRPATRKFRRQHSLPVVAPSRIPDNAEARGTIAGLGELLDGEGKRAWGLWRSGAWQSSSTTAGPRMQHGGGKRGGGAGGLRGAAGLGLGH
jgi:hypothetical protein